MAIASQSSGNPALENGIGARAEIEEISPRTDNRRGPAAKPPFCGPQTVILPRSGWMPIDWRELWEFRELLYFLVWRDIKVRYKQTVLGIAWAVLQPVLSMVVFTVIFGRFAKIPSENLPYAVFVYAGLLPWMFFSNSVSHGGQSLVNQQYLLTKIYLPRLFLPTASIGVALVDLAISFGVYGVILALYGVMPSWQTVFVPLLVLLTAVAALGLSLLVSAMMVSYRDLRYVVQFMLQALMYVSPVVYPVSLIPRRYQWLLALNPMAGIIDGYRAAILGKPWNLTTLCVSTMTALGLFVFGLFYFRRTERRFADIA
jgi:lipopolysaccharide transport system permease protein